MRAFTELLAAHAPYASLNLRIQCRACLDGRGGGEYASTDAWADHIVAELAAAGLRVTTSRPAKQAAEPELML